MLPPTLAEILQTTYPLPPASLAQVLALAEPVELPKGTRLFRDDQLAQHVYVLQRGLARAYARRAEREVTFWFSAEGAVLASIRGYTQQALSYETIELLEDSSLFRLPMAGLQQLYHTDVHLANWGRVMVERVWLQTEQQLIARQFRTAAERYADLLQQSPHLLQRVALGHIASYLGITQVTLSRVRAQLKKAPASARG
ncbi:Crp/Fnr family transcriptional regulator [Hymenobacter chitinivorans]|uniref:CRP-like cAMP-binding protein n=1 Tax=Hymenobacter chitinivorans DSM 11115 TaxID=1121954 RepID=A0A2M9AQY5_9BACT|nr:Crp/Fnr family transcriptional regulator [Hymenobacter chitinivorans]PJJ48114.1 CRP-like cAMP-binding protein [Hymenobacter chitinivorans DSM 11115]